jgi:hypothetical protein
MAVKTTLAQLEEVQAAITKVMSGQQVRLHDGTTLTRASLAELQAREQYLQDRYNRELSRGPAINVGMMKR